MILAIGVGIYLVGMLLIGYLASRRIKDSDDYLVAGRRMPWWMVTATVFASWWGGETVMGAAGIAFTDGIMGTVYDPWAIGGCLLIAGFFYMGIIREMKLRTLGSFFRLRYDQRTLNVVSWLFVPEYVIWTAAQMLGMGKLAHVMLGIPTEVGVLAGAAIIILYTLAGGMLAVAWTDFAQTIIILVGTIVLLPIAINAAGGLEVALAHVPAGHLQLFPAFDDWNTWLWWIAAFCGVGLGSIPAPDLMQRAMIAKDTATAKRSTILAGVGYWTLGMIPLALGIAALALTQSGVLDATVINADPELIVPLMGKTLLPPIAGALLVGALLAGLMSSADTALFAPATLLANDILAPWLGKRKGAALPDRDLLRLTRWCVLGLGVIAAAISFVSDSLYTLLIIAFVYVWNVVFFPFTLGIFWKRANAYGALAGMAAGFAVFMAGVVTQQTASPEPEAFWTLVPAACSGLATVIGSLFTQKQCPPKPLMDDFGNVLKWPELVQSVELKS